MTPPPARAWPRSLVWLHWLTLLALLVTVGAALWRSQVDGRALRGVLMVVHQCSGAAVFVMALIRLAERLRRSDLPGAAGVGWSNGAAKAVRAGMYVAMLAVPLLGWALTSALGKAPPWGWAWPGLDDDEVLADRLGEWHPGLAGLLLLLVALHAAVALFHHFWLRDDVLRSMGPRRAVVPAPPDAPPS